MVTKTPLITIYKKACSQKAHAIAWDSVLYKISKRLPDWLFSFDRTFLLTLPQLEQRANRKLVDKVWVVEQAAEFHFKKLALCRNMIDSEAGIALFKKRVDSGAVCYYLAKKTFEKEAFDILGYVWVSQTENLLEDCDRYHITCDDSQRYIFDTFIHPSVRGQGLYAFMLAETQAAIAGQKELTWFAMVNQYNIASLKAHSKLGARALERITYTSILRRNSYTLQINDEKKHFRRLSADTGLCESLILPPKSPIPVIANQKYEKK